VISRSNQLTLLMADRKFLSSFDSTVLRWG
jgi:hypothetical protein